MKNLLLALLVYHMCNIVNANHWKCIQTFNHCCFALKWTSKEAMLPVYYIGMIFDKIYNLPYNSTIKIGEHSLSLTCTWFYINLFEENNKIFERNIPNINPKKNAYIKKHFPALYKISIKGIGRILTYVWYMTAISLNLINIRSSVLPFIWYSDISYKRDHQGSDFNKL